MLKAEPTFEEATVQTGDEMDPEVALRLKILAELESNARTVEEYEGCGDFGTFPIDVKEYAGLYFVDADEFDFTGFYKDIELARAEALDRSLLFLG